MWIYHICVTHVSHNIRHNNKMYDYFIDVHTENSSFRLSFGIPWFRFVNGFHFWVFQCSFMWCVENHILFFFQLSVAIARKHKIQIIQRFIDWLYGIYEKNLKLTLNEIMCAGRRWCTWEDVETASSNRALSRGFFRCHTSHTLRRILHASKKFTTTTTNSNHEKALN